MRGRWRVVSQCGNGFFCSKLSGTSGGKTHTAGGWNYPEASSFTWLVAGQTHSCAQLGLSTGTTFPVGRHSHIMAAGAKERTFQEGAGGEQVNEENPRDIAWPFPISLSSQAALLCHLLLVTSKSLRAARTQREGN